jgi:MFS family permease
VTAVRSLTQGKWVALVLIAFYTSTWMFLARDLTFYWDDYFILDSQFNDSLLELTASGVNGNWWPLSTLVTWVEVRLFGTWYAGYILVNTLLSAIIGLLLWMIAKDLVPKDTPRYLLAPLLIYPLTLQVSVNSTVLTASWPMSVALALLAALAITRHFHPSLVVIFMVMSWMAMSGMFVINAAIIAAVALVHWARTDTLSRRYVFLGISMICAGVGGTIIGYQVMRYAPSNDLVPPGVGGFLVENLNGGRLVESVTSLSVGWLMSPLIPFAYVYETVITTTAIFVAFHILILIALSLAMGAVGYLLMRRSPRAQRALKDLLPLVAILLGPVVLLAAVMAIARSENMFPPRYGIMWLIPVGLLWLLITTTLAKTSTGVRRVLGVLGSGILLFAVVMFPTTASQAIDVDRPRLEQSAKQDELISLCVTGQEVAPLETMAPGLDPAKFCPIMRELNAVWWFR